MTLDTLTLPVQMKKLSYENKIVIINCYYETKECMCM